MLVPAICPKCGGTLEVDDSQEAAVCKYCSTPFIAERAINNYVSHHNTYINNATIVNKDTADRMFTKAVDLTRIAKYQQAYDAFVEMSLDYPGDWRSWMGVSLLRMHIKKTPALEIDPKLLNVFPPSILKMLNEPNAPLEYPKIKRLENELNQSGRRKENTIQEWHKAENELASLIKAKSFFEKFMIACFGGAGICLILMILSLFVFKNNDLRVGIFFLSLIMIIVFVLTGMINVAKVFSDHNTIDKLKDSIKAYENTANNNTQYYDRLLATYNELKNKMDQKLAKVGVNNVEDYYYYVLLLNPMSVK